MADPVQVAIAEESALDRLRAALAGLARALNVDPVALEHNQRDPYNRATQLSTVASFLESAAQHAALPVETTGGDDQYHPRPPRKSKG